MVAVMSPVRCFFRRFWECFVVKRVNALAFLGWLLPRYLHNIRNSSTYEPFGQSVSLICYGVHIRNAAVWLVFATVAVCCA
jgi:hypothetical protein